MPDIWSDDVEIRAGTYNSGDMGSAYLWSALATQTDMNGGVVDWWPPVLLETGRFPRKLFVVLANGARRRRGKLRFTWIIPMLTFDMLDHIDTTLGYSSTTESVEVTVKTYDESNTAVYINCLAHRPVVENMEPVEGGWSNVPFEFTMGEYTAS